MIRVHSGATKEPTKCHLIRKDIPNIQKIPWDLGVLCQTLLPGITRVFGALYQELGPMTNILAGIEGRFYIFIFISFYFTNGRMFVESFISEPAISYWTHIYNFMVPYDMHIYPISFAPFHNILCSLTNILIYWSPEMTLLMIIFQLLKIINFYFFSYRSTHFFRLTRIKGTCEPAVSTAIGTIFWGRREPVWALVLHTCGYFSISLQI